VAEALPCRARDRVSVQDLEEELGVVSLRARSELVTSANTPRLMPRTDWLCTSVHRVSSFGSSLVSGEVIMIAFLKTS
jgi:hypothetical protein